MFLITLGKIALAFFLLLGGIKFISKSLQESAGGYFYDLLRKYASRPWSGFSLGLLVTVFLQSSSLVTVMIVGFINGGFLSLREGLYIVIGANIGTTFSSQLFSMETRAIVFPFFLIAFCLFFLELIWKKSFGSKIMLGVSFILAGIEMFSIAFKPLADLAFLEKLFLLSKGKPWRGIMTGTIAAAILQSSSVTIGMIILLVKEKILGLPESVAMMMGADLGTCLTSLLASINTILPARQVAWGHLLLNLGCIVLFLPFWKHFLALISLTSADSSRQLANAHLLYNCMGALLFLPMVDIYVKILKNIIKDKNNII